MSSDLLLPLTHNHNLLGRQTPANNPLFIFSVDGMKSTVSDGEGVEEAVINFNDALSPECINLNLELVHRCVFVSTTRFLFAS